MSARTMQPVATRSLGVVANGYVLPNCLASGAARVFGLCAKRTAGASAWVAKVEVSLDGSNWFIVATHSSALGTASGETIFSTTTLAAYWRVNVSTVGAGNTLDILLTASG